MGLSSRSRGLGVDEFLYDFLVWFVGATDPLPFALGLIPLMDPSVDGAALIVLTNQIPFLLDG